MAATDGVPRVMQMFSTGSITRKVMTVILVTCAVVMVLAFGALFTYEVVAARESAARNLTMLARAIAANSTAALAFDNQSDATQVLSAVAADPDVVVAALYDRTGNLFAKFSAGSTPPALADQVGPDGYVFERAHVVLYQPVIVNGRRLGTLFLESNLGSMYERFAIYGSMVGLLAVISGLVAVGLSFRLQRYVSKPIHLLAHAAQAVSERGDYSVRAAKVNDDELGRLTDAFNTMLARVEQQNSALRAQGDELRQEVNDRRRAEEQVRALNADLERRVSERTHALQVANKELESFSYSVSHDLRAPLRHVLGYVEMLEEETTGQLPGEAQRYLETIRKSTLEMSALIDDLLAFARMGRAELQEANVDLDALVGDTIQRHAEATAGRQITWTIEPLPAVIGDKVLLQQVLTNLIGNAIKYSRNRSHATIAIGRSGEEHERAVFFVRDNGAGFDMQYAQKLFGVFQRLHRADQFEGTGIGLATVQRIITRHGGRVWAEAELDKGATFYFTLKTAPAEFAQVEHAIAS
jgi:light-regulated signal transduction histidine kinase (bacteriophytochrome)